jgi:hypothetical protein
MQPDQERPGPDDEIPKRGFWSNLPKRSVSRILILLALLAGIVYLQQRAGAVAGCMSDAFRAPGPAQPPTVRVRLASPQPLDGSAR